MARKARSNWKGGSFKAAVCGCVRKKSRKAAGKLWASFKKDALGIKPKRRKKG